ncbi:MULTISPECIES: VIT1/CCC1 transporter family protein [Micrococcus]|uniref:VIT1/CCC1 transporter family protein n=1 Tax=Micrococcus TaxID=1269 RepID=UPI0005977CB7|nr:MULTISPECIES: VIT1/CCC1 transporter family protein [Micrococcus]KIK88427.1 membrane protein [Micrococcus luteus]MBU8793462.1 VIT1/CCC1 transporter family protein [Micrococcus luteus]MCV7472558.1 VIT1/CCC1 transporter family protein [Micrococcus luteus]MCV7487785.1 VIT1/CCC1 transporter family protein [Micrococcus luteus]MCV7507207.1 VIT1/CCC1 transporter family protein [Micrococcus luteus]
MSPAHTATPAARPEPTREQVRRWRRYLADEIAEGQIYRDIAARKDGVERDILLGLAEAERRHEQHWRALLGEHAENPPRPSLHRILLRWLARIFGSVFVLALAQRAESDTPYAEDQDAPEGMVADEAIHEEVVRGLAARGREQLAGNFRAAVFGMNDGLVSNLALVMGIGATGVAPSVVLFTGVAGLLAGALSMAAGEYVSVRSQRELLEASSPTQITLEAAQHLDLDHNELTLVYLARGMTPEDAEHRALERLGYLTCDCNPQFSARPDGSQGPVDHSDSFAEIGSAWSASLSSFAFFASGALIPILPYIFGMSGLWALGLAAAMVGVALLFTGGVVGLLSGSSPLARGLRQLAIGFGAAAVTYVLGLLFGANVG